MRTEIQKVLNINNFFNVLKLEKVGPKYIPTKTSKILMQNIHREWLQSIWSKTHKHWPVYLHKVQMNSDKMVSYGYINDGTCQHNADGLWETFFDGYAPKERFKLKFNLIIPDQDYMPYFIQWQRYRKYWWSSITTTPSLFGIDDIKYGDNNANVNVVAHFPWGSQAVETVTINSGESILKNTSHLICTTTLEVALFVVLLDGLINSSKEEYMKLHRKMAPYKISFALDCEDSETKQVLYDLAALLHYKLGTRRISTLLPKKSLSLETQLKDSLKMGVAYSAILSENTLTNGIFCLLNSSTMLKEQVHVADLGKYAALICGK